MIASSSDLLQKSSAMFGYLQKSLENFQTFWKMFGNTHLVFGHIFESQIFECIVRILYHKKKLHGYLGIQNFSSRFTPLLP